MKTAAKDFGLSASERDERLQRSIAVKSYKNIENSSSELSLTADKRRAKWLWRLSSEQSLTTKQRAIAGD